REPREHLARRLVGERDGQDPGGAHRARLNQVRDARGEDAGLAAAGTGEDQRRFARQRDRLELLGIEIGEEIAHSEAVRRAANPIFSRRRTGPGTQSKKRAPERRPNCLPQLLCARRKRRTRMRQAAAERSSPNAARRWTEW